MFPTLEDKWTGAAGENACTGLCYLNGYIYASLWLTPARVIKIDATTMTTVDSWTGDADECGGFDVETDGTYIYVGVDDNGMWVPPVKVVKIDPATMTKVDRWVGEDIPPIWPDQDLIWRIVFDGTYLYATEEPSCGACGYKARVTKINPATMAAAGEWNGAAGESDALGITEFGDHFYVSCSAVPAAIVKVNKNTMTTVSRWEGDISDGGDIEGLVWGVTNDGTYLYAATYDYAEVNPLRLIKIDVATMTTIDKYQGDADEMMARSCFYDSVNNHIYIGTYGSPHPMVIRVDPTTMTKVDRWTDVSIPCCRTTQDFAVSNPKQLFASLSGTPSDVLKFKISPPDDVDDVVITYRSASPIEALWV